LSLDETKREGDIVVESNGVKVVYTKQIEGHVSKATIDYSNKWYDRGFRIMNVPGAGC